MGVPIFDAWASQLTKSMPLACLKDSVLGIDAMYYLSTFLTPAKEPLLSALGGFPLGLQKNIEKELQDIQSAGIELHFVFSGLDSGMNEDPFGPSIEIARINQNAFSTYAQDLPKQAVEILREPGFIDATYLSEFLKKVLHENDVPFTVAPFSVFAQLVYFEQHPSHFIDAILGPSELFAYGADKLITKLDLAYEDESGARPKQNEKPKLEDRFNLDSSRFRWIDRRSCLEDLGRIRPETFVDACLLAGSKILRTFPPLENQGLFSKGFSIPDIVTLLQSSGCSVPRLCAQYGGDPQMKKLDYLDRYKRAVTGIRHHVVITKDGDVETLHKDSAPSDVHDCIGQRLPEELSMYISRGMLRPRIFNWLTSGTIFVVAPLEGGDRLEIQNFVRIQLEPLWKQALSLLADSIHRYYQRKEVVTKLWYDPKHDERFNIKDLLPSPKSSLSRWNVRMDVISDRRRELKSEYHGYLPSSLSFAIRSLTNADFASRTVTSKPKDPDQLLKLRPEISANVIWRFLQLRGYIDKDHQLTHWGRVLEATLSAVGPLKHEEEAAFLAVELIHLNLLNADTIFAKYEGAPEKGTPIDRRNCMLVSRVACLGNIRHRRRGYSGPLSRHMLAYHSIISALRASLRDLVEMSLATFFLEGHVDRDRADWMDLALDLPFFEESSCALGTVVMTYLDELIINPSPIAPETRLQLKQEGQEKWVLTSDFSGSLEDAFRLFDAVYKGVKAAGLEVQDSVVWDEANEWLSDKR